MKQKSVTLVLLGVFAAAVTFFTGCDIFDFGSKDTEVILVSPQNDATVGLTLTFSWRIENRKDNVIYQSTVYLDKGSDPLDGNFEDDFFAGTSTEITVTLDEERYRDKTFAWGVIARDSDGKTNFSRQVYSANVE